MQVGGKRRAINDDTFKHVFVSLHIAIFRWRVLDGDAFGPDACPDHLCADTGSRNHKLNTITDKPRAIGD